MARPRKPLPAPPCACAQDGTRCPDAQRLRRQARLGITVLEVYRAHLRGAGIVLQYQRQAVAP